MSTTDRIDGEIVARIQAAQIGLRRDRVVRALCARLKSSLADKIAEGQSVVISLSAPIRRPADTAAALEDVLRDGVPLADLRKSIHGNKVRIRPITGVAATMPKLVVLVHNPDSSPSRLLAIAQSRLTQRS